MKLQALAAALMLGLAAQAPVPPETPPEKEAAAVPAPPEKPEIATTPGDVPAPEDVPVPEEKPAEIEAEAEDSGKSDAAVDPSPAPADAGEPAPEGEPTTEADGSGPSGAEDDAAGEDESAVPLPPDMPEEVEEAQEEAAEQSAPPVADTTQPVAEAACRVRLKSLPIEWELGEPVAEDPCGIGRAVAVTEVAGLEVVPSATLNCRTAEALTLWVRDEVIPAAEEHLEEKPRSVLIAGSYVCRGRNGRPGAKLSEHAFGNAVDIAGFVVGDRTVPVQSRDEGEEPALASFQREIRRAACEHFTTVLGPGTDSSHATHLHFDLRTRSRGYRLCQ